jgi:hypothetical protein
MPTLTPSRHKQQGGPVRRCASGRTATAIAEKTTNQATAHGFTLKPPCKFRHKFRVARPGINLMSDIKNVRRQKVGRTAGANKQLYVIEVTSLGVATPPSVRRGRREPNRRLSSIEVPSASDNCCDSGDPQI